MLGRPDVIDSPAAPEGGGAASAAPTLARLFQEHNASLLQLLRARLRSNDEARDVAQEAYVRLLQLDRVDTIGYLRAYLFRTALNLASNRLRHTAMRAATHRDPVFDVGVDDLSPDRIVLAQEELSAVAAVLQDLPPKTRYAFLLHRFTDLKLEEVAKRVGVSDRMVRSYIVQALRRCHEALDVARDAASSRGDPP